MLSLRHPRRSPGAAVPGPPAAPLIAPVLPSGHQTQVTLLGGLASLGPGIEFTSGGQLACNDVLDERTQILAVEPCSPDELRELRARHRNVSLVVIDRREAASARMMAACLAAGADAYVSSGETRVVTAHLEALARRRAAGPAPA
ncbi:MAG: hypothetical protein JWN46_2418 [Acidimicrobiales bacterium]|nr:hypothetical protein [Acidimicrobiales bacterium]